MVLFSICWSFLRPIKPTIFDQTVENQVFKDEVFENSSNKVFEDDDAKNYNAEVEKLTLESIIVKEVKRKYPCAAPTKITHNL